MREAGTTPLEFVHSKVMLPRVARSSQPWASGRNPFGIYASTGAVGSLIPNSLAIPCRINFWKRTIVPIVDARIKPKVWAFVANVVDSFRFRQRRGLKDFLENRLYTSGPLPLHPPCISCNGVYITLPANRYQDIRHYDLHRRSGNRGPD